MARKHSMQPKSRARPTATSRGELRRRRLLIGLGLVVAALVAWPLANRIGGARYMEVAQLVSVEDLIEHPDQIARLDILNLNILCADGLQGAGQLKEPDCRSRLAAMVTKVRTETDRHFYKFKNGPAEFEHSEGFFRMLMMAVVLVEDFGVRYNPERRIDPDRARMGDGFFSDAAEVFVPGLLRHQPSGTCSSLPVLYVAIGRELGYPLKLVTTKGHLFVRWEGLGERFNVEATGNGLNRLDDEYYKQWPFPLTEEEITKEDYLTSLTPEGEAAVFLSIRAMCLLEAGRADEARECFAAAAKLNPKCQSYRLMAGSRAE